MFWGSAPFRGSKWQTAARDQGRESVSSIAVAAGSDQALRGNRETRSTVCLGSQGRTATRKSLTLIAQSHVARPIRPVGWS